ncbi:MAG: hypothetical protein ACI9WU_002629, partial [Myxococcota bacterium]
MAALAALTALWVAHVWSAFAYPLGNDPAIFQFYGWAMTVGELPYVDAYDVNTPGIMLLHFGWGSLAGFTDPAFLSLALGLSTLCLLGAGLTLLRPGLTATSVPKAAVPTAAVPTAAVVLGMAVGIWAFTQITPWDRGQRELFQGVLLLAAMGSARRSPLVAGALAGMAFTLKLAILPVLWVVWMAWLWDMSRQNTPHAVRRTVASFVGFVIPVVSVFAWLWQVDALDAFMDIMNTYLPLHNQVLRVAWTDAMAQPLPIAVLVLGIAAAATGHRVLGAALLGNIAIYLYQRHGWTYHLNISVPLMAPAAALVASHLPTRFVLPAALLPAIFAVLTVHYDLGDGLVRAEQIDDHWRYSAHVAVAEYLQANGTAADRVLTNNDEQQLLYMARRRAATP